MIRALLKTEDYFKNSANAGRVSYALFSKKQSKSPINTIYFSRFKKIFAKFSLNFIAFLGLTCSQTPIHLKQSP